MNETIEIDFNSKDESKTWEKRQKTPCKKVLENEEPKIFYTKPKLDNKNISLKTTEIKEKESFSKENKSKEKTFSTKVEKSEKLSVSTISSKQLRHDKKVGSICFSCKNYDTEKNVYIKFGKYCRSAIRNTCLYY